jgi:hypothetical protein
MPSLISTLAQEAIQVQDAVNMGGVARRFAEVVATLQSNGLVQGTDDLNRHPIVRMWVSKMHDLAGMGLTDPDQFSLAYSMCRQLMGDG